MRKIKEILRLKHQQGLSNRQIAASCNISKSSVSEYLERAEKAGLTWPLPADLDETGLEQKLFSRPFAVKHRKAKEPDCESIHRELKRKGVTLFLLWEEYKQANPQGFQYSWFCKLYRNWQASLDVVMRQEHRAGEKVFVDYAGQTVDIQDRSTGEIIPAQIFIAVLGASNYTYAEATWSQKLPDWISSHIRAFEFFQGVPRIVIPDNLKAGVSKPHTYEPDINPTYQEMANHYQVAVIPARKQRPRDKAKVEVGVQIVERWILARLRNHTFFSLAALNQAIRELLTKLNDRPFQKLAGTRHSLFQELDKPALQSLPSTPYEYAEHKKVRVNLDYHVEIDRHYYSVPHRLVHKQLLARITDTVVEIFHKDKRVASHIRAKRKGGYTTVKEHMPRAHKEYAEWTPERILRWAETMGPNVAMVMTTMLKSRPVPQQGFRSCLGILRLGQSYGEERLEKACIRALRIEACSYKSIESILKSGLDQQDSPETTCEHPALTHENVRGTGYYH